eukprot:9009679-Alexandrium_andersonii.AAC.1
MPPLQLLADPRDDAGGLVLEDEQDGLLPHVGERALAGVRMVGPQVGSQPFGKVLNVPNVLHGLVDVAEDATLAPSPLCADGCRQRSPGG